MKTSKFTVFPTGSIFNYYDEDESIDDVVICNTLEKAKAYTIQYLTNRIEQIKKLKYKDIPFSLEDRALDDYE